MNTIVREHYPADLLPEDWRAELGVPGNVTLTLTISASPETPAQAANLGQLLARVRATRTVPAVTADEAVARIRALRDEWDDR